MSAQPEQLSILACRLLLLLPADAAVEEATARVVERRMERRRRMVRVDECMLAWLLLFDVCYLIATTTTEQQVWYLYRAWILDFFGFCSWRSL